MADTRVFSIVSGKPEAESALREAFEVAMTATRAEPDCVSCDVFSAEGAPATFVMLQAFRSKDAHATHSTSTYVQALLGVVREHSAAPHITYKLHSIDE
jgi:quinol monooxygenase YgiN